MNENILQIFFMRNKSTIKPVAAINDFVYSFELLEIFSPDPDYKVDEIELRKSINKSREMMEVIRKFKDERMKSGDSW